MYPVFRSLLFRLDPEQAHSLTLRLIRLAGQLPPARGLVQRLFAAPQHPVEAFGLRFSNPVGLAAGYDKDGLGWRGLAALGFGHIEVGTVTLRPQPGNPQPRVFRLPEDQALINRMGFPGEGASFVQRQLGGKRPPGLVVGVNLGKNKDTPLEEAPREYLELARRFAPLVDYLAINVSSPNTIGLRRLQARDALQDLLSQLQAAREQLNVPLVVKLAPDLAHGELEDALEAILSTGMDGVIATNTTLARPGLRSPKAGEAGGLSGAPLRPLSQDMLHKIVRLTEGRLPVVAAGGIMTTENARQRLEAGAALVQLYTGLIYAGPALVKNILRSL
jgi:dihydroorotate dehydrogenase